MDFSAHRALLASSKIIIERFERYALSEGLFFNVFELLDRHKDEVKCHSALIAFFLNNKGLHGKGDVFYRKFLSVLNLDNLAEGDKLSYSVEVEKNAYFTDAVSGEDTNGRIDIWIKSDSYILIIENKIYADDQERQLERYRKYAEKYSNGRDVYLFYLNLKGEPPGSYSLGSLKESDYQIISYQTHISRWVEECIKEVAKTPVIRETLIQYLTVINKLTGTPIHKELEMQLIELLRERGMVKIALEIQKAVQSLGQLIEREFFENVQRAMMKEFGLSKKDMLSDYDKGKSIYYGVKLILGDHECGSFCFGLEVNKDGMKRGYYLHDDKSQRGKRGMDDTFSGKLLDHLEGYENNVYWLAYKQVDGAPSFLVKDDTYFDLIDKGDILDVANEVASDLIKEISDVIDFLKGSNVEISWRVE